MSVKLYKDGEAIYVPPLSLYAHLGNGYFLTREESLEGEDPVDDGADDDNAPDDGADDGVDDFEYETPALKEHEGKTDAEIEAESDDEVSDDEVSDDEVSEEDIRLVAKDLGIRPWKNMQIDKLIVKIEEKQRGDSV